MGNNAEYKSIHLSMDFQKIGTIQSFEFDSIQTKPSGTAYRVCLFWDKIKEIVNKLHHCNCSACPYRNHYQILSLIQVHHNFLIHFEKDDKIKEEFMIFIHPTGGFSICNDSVVVEIEKAVIIPI